MGKSFSEVAEKGSLFLKMWELRDKMLGVYSDDLVRKVTEIMNEMEREKCGEIVYPRA